MMMMMVMIMMMLIFCATQVHSLTYLLSGAGVWQGGAERQHADSPQQQLPDLPAGTHGPLQVSHFSCTPPVTGEH